MFDVPKETSQDIAAIQHESNRSANDLAQESMRGVDQSASLMNDAGSFDEGIGFSNQTLKRAIQNRARGDYERSMNRLKTENSIDSVNRKFERLKNAAGLVAQEHAHNQQARRLRYMERQRKKAMRGQIISSVLGIGGAVAGGMLTAGSPGGIMAGSMIGSGVGGVIGGGSQGG